MATSRNALECLAATALLPHVQELQDRLASVQKGDEPEDLHQMRVASRRLRAGLNLYRAELKEPRLRPWSRAVRRITRSLGSARDTDVKMEFLRRHLDELPEEQRKTRKAGLERLLLRLGQKRASQQKKIRKVLKPLSDAGVLNELQEQLNRWKIHAELESTETEPAPSAFHSSDRIRLLIEDLLCLEPGLSDPGAVADHHRLRLAVKRLRYTLENQNPDTDGSLEPKLRLIRRIQKHLGRIHDTDMWIDFLPKFLRKERRRHRKFHGHERGFSKIARGVEGLLEDLKQKRSERHERLLAFWNEEISPSFWKELLDETMAPPVADPTLEAGLLPD